MVHGCTPTLLLVLLGCSFFDSSYQLEIDAAGDADFSSRDVGF
jgi:hypothetical protein